MVGVRAVGGVEGRDGKKARQVKWNSAQLFGGVCGFPGLPQNCPVLTLIFCLLVSCRGWSSLMRNSTPCAWPGLWIMVSTSPGPLGRDWGSRRVLGWVDWGRWGEWVSPHCCQVHGAAPLLSGFPQEGRVRGGCIRSPAAARSSGDSEGHPADTPSLNPTSWLSKLKHVTCQL